MNLKVNYAMILIAVISFTSNRLSAQEIKGTVLDTEDDIGIPFVNVHIKGTSIGGISDVDGKFDIGYHRGTSKNDSLVFSYMGYRTRTISIEHCIANPVVYLNREAEQLNEITVSNKALPYTDYLMKKVLKLA